MSVVCLSSANMLTLFFKMFLHPLPSPQSTPKHPLRCLHKSVLGFTFEMLDADGDGAITQKEYNAGFGILDSDGGGSLSRKEFGLKSLEHFDMLDVNRNGKLTKTSSHDLLLMCWPHQQEVV